MDSLSIYFYMKLMMIKIQTSTFKKIIMMHYLFLFRYLLGVFYKKKSDCFTLIISMLCSTFTQVKHLYIYT